MRKLNEVEVMGLKGGSMRGCEGEGEGVASLSQLPTCEAPRNKSDLISSKHFRTRLPISVLS